MGIKFRCQACDKKLHVKTFLAGKRGVCPRCGAKIRIPRVSQTSQSSSSGDLTGGRAVREHAAQQPVGARSAISGSPSEVVSRGVATSAPGSAVGRGSAAGAAADRDPISEAPDAVWYVRPPSGGQYGPADGAIMRRWLEEGRVSADSLVWREGWPDWKPAGPVFPSLEVRENPAPSTEPVAIADASANEFAVSADGAGVKRLKGRLPARSHGRNIAIVVTLSIVCVALIVALFIVLRGHG